MKKHEDSSLCWAALFLRLGLGFIFLFAGLGKIVAGYNTSINYLASTMGNSYLPQVLIKLFAGLLPLVEIPLGALLLIGLWRRITLPLSGALFLLFIFGSLSMNNYDLASRNFIYLLGLAATVALQQYDHAGLS